MRLKLYPENIIEFIALLLGKLPTPLLEAYYGGAYSKSLIAGLRLGIFDSIKDRTKTAEEIANDINCDLAGLTTLLNALTGFNYLYKKGEKYSVNRKVRNWLLKDTHNSMKDAILFTGDVFDIMNNIEEIVKSGKVNDFHNQDKPDSFWNNYITSLAKFAHFTAPEITKKAMTMRNPLKLLDVGGGHGIYSMSFCKRYTHLMAKIIDLPKAASIGEKIIIKEGFSERITYIKGDMREVNWGKGYDIILLFNVIHTITEYESLKLIEKSYISLNDKGTLIILDSEHTGGSKKLSATSGFNELMFFIITGKRTYSERNIRKWITNAGFSKVKKKNLFTMPMTLFLNAIK
jgi:ubiquinone/menaquinone biosynthesis C-methylase UbiE